MMIRTFLLLITTFFYTTTHASANPPSARVLEYLDKVHDFTLENATATVLLENREHAHAQIIEDCAPVRNQVGRGIEYAHILKQCQINTAIAATAIAEQKLVIAASARNIEIWKIRLSGERGETMDLKRLAEIYVQKWRDSLDLVEVQIQTANLRVDYAKLQYEWAIRTRARYVNNNADLLKLHYARLIAEGDLKALIERKKVMEASGVEAQQNTLFR